MSSLLHPQRLLPPLIMLVLACAVGLGSAPAARAAAGCDRFASATGNDAWPGTASAPFATVQKLADALAPGMVGCVGPGTYAENVTLTNGGRANAPITIRTQD